MLPTCNESLTQLLSCTKPLPRRFEYREATCLFLACAHTHPHIVEWLIENGVDTDTECGHHQKAIDVIGLSNDNPAKNKSIKELLKQPKKVPKPPPEPSCRAKIGFEEVVKVIYVDVPHQNPNRPPVPTPKRVAETVAHCKVTVTWRCYWHLPGLTFQLRHKVDDPRGDDIDLKWVYDDVNGHTRWAIVCRAWWPSNLTRTNAAHVSKNARKHPRTYTRTYTRMQPQDYQRSQTWLQLRVPSAGEE
mmetsp:Transcript_91238/g.260609  ORF Transcript_91238/g.260609 Transcript_91238/m.260609 type:complete len:246 (+) Transcript_91238:41-778(+)